MLRVLTTSFDPAAETIEVEAVIHGPRGSINRILALDTGASQTVLDSATFQAIGYDDPQPLNWMEMIGLGSVHRAPVIRIDRFECLGLTRIPFDVVYHDLPDEAGIAGLLGLDFFRDMDLRIDFKTGRLTLRG